MLAHSIAMGIGYWYGYRYRVWVLGMGGLRVVLLAAPDLGCYMTPAIPHGVAMGYYDAAPSGAINVALLRLPAIQKIPTRISTCSRPI